jgi:transposase-like protein
MARYGQKFKDNAVARLLPPQSCPVETLSARIGISVGTLERWRAEALANASGNGGGGANRWTAVARLEAVIATAAMDEATRAAWFRERGCLKLPGAGRFVRGRYSAGDARPAAT